MINVSNLEKSFGTIDALRGISFSVDEGLIYAVVGPDGAGKTTLLRILAGIMKADKGEIEIIGRDIIANPEAAKINVGYLSQKFSLNPVLTVGENIDFFGKLFMVQSQDISSRKKRLLEFSHLGPFQNHQASKLSGGMKQKLALCCALIHTPKILLLDEPTTGVDPISRRELWEILYDLLGEGVTIVVSTPYMDEAERAGQIMLMHNGQPIMAGSLEQLKAQYQYDLYEIVSDDNREIFDRVSKKIGQDRIIFFGDKLHLALAKDDRSDEFKQWLETMDVKIISFERVEPGLEDLFIQELSGAG
jgi:ABC-2 type transport system ATP-binding protein